MDKESKFPWPPEVWNLAQDYRQTLLLILRELVNLYTPPKSSENSRLYDDFMISKGIEMN